MQDLADSISPIHSFDSLTSLNNEADESRLVDGTDSLASAQQKYNAMVAVNNSLNTSTVPRPLPIRSVVDQPPVGYYRENPPVLTSSEVQARVTALKNAKRDVLLAGSDAGSVVGTTCGGRGQSEAAKERRRERNRLLAKKTRVKNKEEVENLRKEIEFLKNENNQLKNSVKDILATATRSTKFSNVHSSDQIMSAVKEIVSLMDSHSNGSSGNNGSSLENGQHHRAYNGSSTMYMSHGYSNSNHSSTGEKYPTDGQTTDSARSSSKSGTEAPTDSSSSDLGPQSDSAGSISENGSGSGSEEDPPQKKTKST